MSALLVRIAVPLLATAALAQDAARPSPPPTPVFTLAAGRHDLQAFVDLTAQIRKAPIRFAVADSEAAARPVVVQRELRLDAVAFEDVATTLLFASGVLIVPDERPGEFRAVATDGTAPELAMAVPRTPAELAARPHRLEYVTTTVPCPADQVARRLNLLRPFFAARGGLWRLRPAAAEGALSLTGTTRQVISALTLLQLQEGTKPVATPAPTWRDKLGLPWPGGAMQLPDFVDLLAERLDGNVLGDITALRLDLGAAAELPPSRWYARATQVLRAADRVLVPLDPERRIFTLLPLQGSDALGSWHAGYEPATMVAASDAIVPVLTTIELQHMTTAQAANLLRPRLVGSPTLIWGSLSPQLLVACGLRDEVAKVVAEVRVAEAARGR